MIDLDVLNALAEPLPSAQNTLDSLYIKALDNSSPNLFSNWFNQLDPAGTFFLPKSFVLKLPKTAFGAVLSESESEQSPSFDEIEVFNKTLHKILCEQAKTKNPYPLFVKNGFTANKFDFWNCMVLHQSQIYKNLHNIMYASLIHGTPLTNEVVFRQWVPTQASFHIYGTLPLNMEYRVFVDFDKQSVVGIVDYWHKNLVGRIFGAGEELAVQHFMAVKNKHQEMFDSNCQLIKNKLLYAMNSGEMQAFKGLWSIDFLMDYKNQPWLIDMANGHESWGLDLLSHQQQEYARFVAPGTINHAPSVPFIPF